LPLLRAGIFLQWRLQILKQMQKMLSETGDKIFYLGIRWNPVFQLFSYRILSTRQCTYLRICGQFFRTENSLFVAEKLYNNI
jgi:hypothetical protein